MNPGASAFLIFLFIVGAFAGLGYLVPEMNRQAGEIKDLQELKIRLEAELINLRQTIQVQQAALEQAQAKILELEGSVQSEQAAKEEAYRQIQSLQQAHDQAQRQIAALQAEIQALRERANAEIASPTRYSIPTAQGTFVPWLLPVVVMALGGGYCLHRVRFGKRLFSSAEEASATGLLQSPAVTAEPPSEWVRVLVPRDRIPEFVKWLRNQ